jgi:hypothetical protein
MTRTFLLVLANFAFIVMIGGAVYEHAAVVPVWSAAVPASLSMFQGDYPLSPASFWIPIHPIALSLMTTAAISNWKTRRRNYILAALAGYAVILATTFFFFVPELMAITQSAFSPAIDAHLTARASLWETLSLTRLAVLTGLACVMLAALSQNGGSPKVMGKMLPEPS